MSSGTVSIVIPTYRRPEKLLRAAQSVLAQTYGDVRLLIFDNASNDGTRQTIAGLSAADRRVEYFCQERNLGMVGNVNFALSRIATPFFGVLPDDDFYLPNFVEDAIRAFARHPRIKVSILAAPTVDEAGTVLSDQLSAWPKEGLYEAGESITVVAQGHQPIITTCLFRSEIAEELKYDEKTGVIADIPVLIAVLGKYPFHLSKVVGGYFVKHAQGSGPNFGHRSNVRAICPAFLRVEECVDQNSTIASRVKSVAVRCLARRVDKAFYDLLLANALERDIDSFKYMRTVVLRRKPFNSVWQVGSVLLCCASMVVGYAGLFSGLTLARRVRRRLRHPALDPR